MPKINIFLMGQNHEDPAPKYLLLQELQRAQAAGITVAVFAEAPSELSLREVRQLTELNFNTSADLVDLQAVVQAQLAKLNSDSQAYKELSRGYLPPAEEQKFIRNCRDKANFTNPQNVRSVVNYLVSGRNNCDWDIAQIIRDYPIMQLRLKFYQTLEAAQVFYAGIDMSQVMYQIQDKAQQDPLIPPGAITQLLEEQRSSWMARNIHKDLAKLADSGGLVFVNDLGMVHCHRIAYFLNNLLKAEPIKNLSGSSLKINIIPLHMFSTHQRFPGGISNDYSDFFTTLARHQKGDSLEALAFYEEQPALEVFCSAGATEDAFLCPRFTNLIECFVYQKGSPSAVIEHPSDSPLLLFNIWKKPATTVARAAIRDEVENSAEMLDNAVQRSSLLL